MPPMLDAIAMIHTTHPEAITYHWDRDIVRLGFQYVIEIDFKKVVVPVERSTEFVPAVTFIERPALDMPERPTRRLNFRRGEQKKETAT